jgi:hypothetical protein
MLKFKNVEEKANNALNFSRHWTHMLELFFFLSPHKFFLTKLIFILLTLVFEKRNLNY